MSCQKGPALLIGRTSGVHQSILWEKVIGRRVLEEAEGMFQDCPST